MNSILAGGGGGILDRFNEFARGMTPEQAKARVEQMVASGQMSPQQLERLKADAEAFARMFGIR